MTISREEFERVLPGATGCEPRPTGGSSWRGGDDDCGWIARIEPLPDLALGSLRLPRHRVRLEMHGFAGEARSRFLARWELNFRRGGG